MVDKLFCMSAYLAFKFNVDDHKTFFEGVNTSNYQLPSPNKYIYVDSAQEIHQAILSQIENYKDKKAAIFLSGGMDSAIVASYFPDADAYTFRYSGIDYPEDELHRAECFADYYHLNLHYVDINLESMLKNLDFLMIHKGSPVYYIEPQLLQAALQAKKDGAETVMVGEGSDLAFGGLGWFLSRNWTADEFPKIYTSTDPVRVLKQPQSVDCVYKKYSLPDGMFDFTRFLNEIFYTDAYTSYQNAFSVADIDFFDPFEYLRMSTPLDLDRVRNGEPKYLIRELFSMRYPGIPLPEKIRQPNPLDCFLCGWEGPKRGEFLKNLDMNQFRGKNKWQIYCLERFLNLYDSGKLKRGYIEVMN